MTRKEKLLKLKSKHISQKQWEWVLEHYGSKWDKIIDKFYEIAGQRCARITRDNIRIVQKLSKQDVWVFPCAQRKTYGNCKPAEPKWVMYGIDKTYGSRGQIDTCARANVSLIVSDDRIFCEEIDSEELAQQSDEELMQAWLAEQEPVMAPQRAAMEEDIPIKREIPWSPNWINSGIGQVIRMHYGRTRRSQRDFR